MRHLFATLLLGAAPLLGIANATGKEADCSVARDPRRCEAQQVAREACSGLQGQAHSACMREALPPPDCGRAPNSVQCQARQRAEQTCQDKRGAARRKCIRDKTSSG